MTVQSLSISAGSACSAGSLSDRTIQDREEKQGQRLLFRADDDDAECDKICDKAIIRLLSSKLLLQGLAKNIDDDVEISLPAAILPRGKEAAAFLKDVTF